MTVQRKTAIVTGASQGIGAGIAKGFVERGFNVVANSRKVTQSTEVAASNHVALGTAHRRAGNCRQDRRNVTVSLPVDRDPPLPHQSSGSGTRRSLATR